MDTNVLKTFVAVCEYSGEIKHLPVNDCDVSVWTQLLIHKNKWKSPALNAFIDFYRDVIRK